ncbi:hypothetical protein LI291_00650 [Intestinibacillus massiliensis]|nr:hypothetical protein [Intestinibacillus massiliensis]
MAIASQTIAVVLIFWLAVLVGGVVLQIFLSRRESRWPGLVLPALTFLYSLLGLLGILGYGMHTVQFALQAFVTMLMMNIPTLVLLAIYFACRSHKKKAAELDKMNIQDLD